MTASERMVKRAREIEKEREGVRVKARLPDAMWKRVERCAAGACMAAEEWVCAACSAWLKGKFDGVSFDEKELLGTRDASAPHWVRVPHGFDTESLRRTLASAVAWHEPRLPRVTPQKGTEHWVEGRDYRVRSE